MSDENVQAESAETGDLAQPPEFIPSARAAAPAKLVTAPAEPGTEPETIANSLDAVHRAALEAEQAVIESQYSEGLGKREERKTATQQT
jgi:hypothetical protein